MALRNNGPREALAVRGTFTMGRGGRGVRSGARVGEEASLRETRRREFTIISRGPIFNFRALPFQYVNKLLSGGRVKVG